MENILNNIVPLYDNKIEIKKHITISTAKSRFDKNLQQQRVSWDEFIEMFRFPKRSTETLIEYLNYSKDKQDNLKDVGGFVGGVLEGKKCNDNVKSRSLVNFDLDEIEKCKIDVIIDNIKKLDCAYIIHSTRKHSKTIPRIRILIPISRFVTPEQFQMISRKFAELVDISACDKASFVLSQLMYWPSCCKDSDYYFEYEKYKKFISPEDIFAFYDKKELEETFDEIKKLGKNQQDPLKKKGIVGIFCRIYNIYEAMEKFIPGVYEEYCKDRYTYVAGSTTGGAIVYQNGKFIYSRHSTDPICNRLCNSFDMVRLHLYKDLDKDAKPDIHDYELPSYIKMILEVESIPEVKALLDKELIKFDYLEDLDYEDEDIIQREEKVPLLPTDVCAAKLMIKYKFLNIGVGDNSVLCIYDEERGIYTSDTFKIEKIIFNEEKRYKESQVKDVKYKIRLQTLIVEQEKKPHLIPLNNGIFNTHTKKLEPFNPDYVFTTKVGTNYVENPPDPSWDVDGWLLEIACYETEVVELFYQMFNESINGNYTRGKYFIFVGSGNNGKGTMSQLLINLVGRENCSFEKMKDIGARFHTNNMVGKTLNIGDDLEGDYIEDSSTFRSIVTGDYISVEEKYGRFYGARLTLANVFSSNDVPNFKNKTNGTYRRMCIIPFKADFNGNNEDGKIENKSIKEEKIYRKDVLEYILYYALQKDFKDFIEPDVVKEELEQFKEVNDPLREFYSKVWMGEKFNKTRAIPTDVVFKTYQAFANNGGYQKLSRINFVKQFTELVKDTHDKKPARVGKDFQELMSMIGYGDYCGNDFFNNPKYLKTTQCFVEKQNV